MFDFDIVGVAKEMLCLVHYGLSVCVPGTQHERKQAVHECLSIANSFDGHGRMLESCDSIHLFHNTIVISVKAIVELCSLHIFLNKYEICLRQ